MEKFKVILRPLENEVVTKDELDKIKGGLQTILDAIGDRLTQKPLNNILQTTGYFDVNDRYWEASFLLRVEERQFEPILVTEVTKDEWNAGILESKINPNKENIEINGKERTEL